MRTRDIGAEIRPSIDLARLSHEWELLEGREQRTLAEIRLAKGKLLIEARKAFPKTGNDGAWTKHLAKWKIADRTARDYMRLAGYVESTSAIFAEAKPAPIPTYVEAGIKPSPVETRQPVSAIEQLIVEGVEPREAALQVAGDASVDWMLELERLGESMRRAARSLFASAEAMDALCRQHAAAISSPTVLTMRSMLVAAKTSIQKTLQLMGKDDSK